MRVSLALHDRRDEKDEGERMMIPPSSFLRAVAKETLLRAGVSGRLPVRFTIGVAIVSGEEIRRLNREYRGKDKVTDVLSFGEIASLDELRRRARTEEEIGLGDVVIDLAVVAVAACKDGLSFEREFVYIFSHGVLHLSGYDHEPEMFDIQDEVTDLFTKMK